MNFRCGILLLVSFLSAFQVVSSGGRLSLQFISFSNPGHRQRNGHCCDNVKFCINNCDVFLRLCLNLRNQPECSLLNVQTSELGDDSFNFGSSLGNGLSNPLVHSFSQWKVPFRMKVTSLDNDGGNIIGRSSDLISINEFDITRSPDANIGSAVSRSVSLRGYRSLLKLKYKIYCDAGYFKPSCSEYCTTTDDSSGHYTCDFANSRRICMSNWYGSKCKIFCRAQNDNASGHYRCSSNGDKVCLSGWYGNDCKQYCMARNDSNGHYTCSEEGNKICLKNWYGVDCLKYCIPPRHDGWHFTCNKSGGISCFSNWYGANCSKYCNSDASRHYQCLENGTKICDDAWFGINCTQYCKPVSGSSANYMCSENGIKICGLNWYGEDCNVYCRANATSKYICMQNGTKLCHKSWHGLNCDVYCENSNASSLRYSCSADGRNVCNAGWYGINCTRYTGCIEKVSNASRYYCDNTTGEMICKSGWIGAECQQAVDDFKANSSENLNKPSTSKSGEQTKCVTSLPNLIQPTIMIVATSKAISRTLETKTNVFRDSVTTKSHATPSLQTSRASKGMDHAFATASLTSVSRLSKDGAQASSFVSEKQPISASVRENLRNSQLPFVPGLSLSSHINKDAIISSSYSQNLSRYFPSTSAASTDSQTTLQNNSFSESSNTVVTSRFRILAYICGPLLLCTVVLMTIAGCRQYQMGRKSKVKKIKRKTKLSRPLITGLLKSTPISSPAVQIYEMHDEPQAHDRLLGYHDC